MYLPPKNKPQNNEITDFINKINHDFTWSNDTLDLDYLYIFNKNFYEKSFKIYEGYHGKLIIQTAIVLPFHIPINDSPISVGLQITDYESGFATFIFSSFEENKKYLAGLLPEYGLNYPIRRTRCEISFLLRSDIIHINDEEQSLLKAVQNVRKSKSEPDIENVYSESRMVFQAYDVILKSAIKYLNSFIMSFAFNSDDDSVFFIDENNIEHVSHFRVIEVPEWITYNWLSIHNTYFPVTNYNNLESKKIGQIYANAKDFYKNEFLVFFQFYQRSKYEYQQGSSINSLIFSVVSIEVLLKKVFYLYSYKVDSKSIEAIEKEIELLTFKKLFTSKIPNILGGSWDVSNNNNIPGEWFNTSYKIRNRIVHAGLSPNQVEIDESIISSTKLYEYIRTLVLQRLKQLPFLQDLVAFSKASIVEIKYD